MEQRNLRFHRLGPLKLIETHESLTFNLNNKDAFVPNVEVCSYISRSHKFS